ncbi:MAG: hypothetical protein ACP5JS_05905 [Fervidobacterium sp.]
MKRKNASLVASIVSVVVIITVVFILTGLVILQSKIRLIEKTFSGFKVLSIKETFEKALGNSTVSVGLFGNPRIMGLDEMKNKYMIEVFNTGNMIIYINGSKVEDSEQAYKKLYTKALYNLLFEIRPDDYEQSDPKKLFNYVSVTGYEYVNTGGKEFLVLSGSNSNSQNVQVWTKFRRTEGNVRVSIEKVIIDGKELSLTEMRVLLSNVYNVEKRGIKDNLVELIKGGSIKEFPGVSVSDILEKLKNPRWTIKNEAENTVEFNGVTELDGKESVVTVGLALANDGSVTITYILVDGNEIPTNKIVDMTRYIYAKYGYDLRAEFEGLKQKILNAQVPNYDKTFGKLFENACEKTEWNYSCTSNGIRLTILGTTKLNKNVFSLSFLSSSEGLFLVSGSINNNNVTPNEVINMLTSTDRVIGTSQEGTSIGTTNADTKQRSDNLITLVQSSLIVSGTPYKDNKTAFESFLRNATWSYDSVNDKVTLSGTGLYVGRSWQLKFIFEILLGNKALLQDVYMNNSKAIDEVTDYMIGKIFKVDLLTKGIVELVKNSMFSTRKYSDFLGDEGWLIDKDTDTVVFSNGRLHIKFAVEPGGDVKVVKLTYNGSDYTTKKDELLAALEKGQSLDIILSPNISIPAEKKTPTTTQTDSAPTDTQKGNDENSKQLQPYQF